MDDWMVAGLVAVVVMLGGAIGVIGALWPSAPRHRPVPGAPAVEPVPMDAEPQPR